MAANNNKNLGRIKVVDNPMLERDTSSSAIINRNSSEYSRRMSNKRLHQSRENELITLRNSVTELSAAVLEMQKIIKDLK